jgi:hypothetical protein
MSINNLPSSIASVIQQGFLERRFRDALTARLGFRLIADREPFDAGIGETLTKTRTGLLPAVTAPMSVASNTDLTSGLTPQNYSVEQFILGIDQYSANMMLNVATSKVAIASLFMRNAYTLGEQAARSVDTIAQQALFNAYMGGNTRVTTTLGSAGTAVKVDDIRGFISTLNSKGQPVSVSSSNQVVVSINGTGYSLIGAVADGAAPATLPYYLAAFMSFSGTSSNTSTTPGGYSGTLTFATNVTVADATVGNAVISSVAPAILRPALSSNQTPVATTAAISSANCVNNGKLTIQQILAAKAQLEANNVPPSEASGLYECYADPIHMTGLYGDPVFQSFFRGRPDSEEYRRGAIAELLGVSLRITNMNPVQSLANVGTVRRAILCGQGALVEGVFTRTAYEAANQVDDGNLTTVVDDIAHVTREPIDALKQVVTQTWSYIGGFVAPTDTTANPTVLPTASNAALKRACILESL